MSVYIRSDSGLTALDSRPSSVDRTPGEAFFRALIHNSDHMVIIVDADNAVRYASPSTARLFGTRSITGNKLESLVHPADRASAVRTLEWARRGQPRARGGDWRVVHADGRERRVEVSCRDLRHDPAVNGVVVTLHDVTRQRRLERELTRQASLDPLTGLPNRTTFRKLVERAVTRPRGGRRAAVAVLVVDLDDFRVVNETLGHDCGDDLLVAVGERLTAVGDRLDATVRARATVARLGGDEFAVLIEQVGDQVEADRAAEEILAGLADPVTLGRRPLSCRASVGVATTTQARSCDELLRQADLALYAAKRAGKGRWSRFQPAVHARILDRLTIRADLDKAVRNDELTLDYQPIVTLDSGRTVGFEALLRWRHPTRGVVPPLEFIDVAEESGLIIPIGERVLELAVAAATRWRRVRPGPTSVSVNVSARQFRSPSFVDVVRHRLATSGLPPECLVLEITESLLLRDGEDVWADLGRLRDTGVRVAIDDFGTGYSALSYLRQIPIDIIKIDKSFVDTVTSSRQQRALVDGIVRLAHTLGLQVVAEGIERREEGAAVARMGCRFAQGFFFARPMNAPDATRWLRHGLPTQSPAAARTRNAGGTAGAALSTLLPGTRRPAAARA